jgi:[acyl-carrier-protein] S-malonyltransferase
VLVLLCPGQGAQTAGFLAPWLELPGVADRFESLSSAAGFDLSLVGSAADADVVDTAVAQPLLVATAVVTGALLGDLPTAGLFAGHSVGELSAAALAGAVDATTAVGLGRDRGRAMADACAEQPSGMTAILGGDEDGVLEAVRRAGCTAANRNGAGQVVAAGTTASLQRLADDPPAGARLRPLAVAGAFHTALMSTAASDFAGVVRGVPFAARHRPVISNADGALVTDGAELARRLAAQVSAPVRFDRCLQTMLTLGVTAAVELAPGGVLGGLVRKTLPDVEVVTLRGPGDLDAARAVLAEWLPGDQRLTTDWTLVVAPDRGTFHLEPDNSSRAGLGVVRTRGGDVVVAAEQDAAVIEWLASEGDPVAAGQPLARVARRLSTTAGSGA